MRRNNTANMLVFVGMGLSVLLQNIRPFDEVSDNFDTITSGKQHNDTKNNCLNK